MIFCFFRRVKRQEIISGACAQLLEMRKRHKRNVIYCCYFNISIRSHEDSFSTPKIVIEFNEIFYRSKFCLLLFRCQNVTVCYQLNKLRYYQIR